MIFKKLKLNKTSFANRIVVSAMCQYSGHKGCPTKWHYKHLGALMSSNAGAIFIESTAVNKQGMITHNDLALYNDKQKQEFKKLIIHLKNINDKIPIGMQISHSGRKGSANLPWVKRGIALDKKEQAWLTVAPSPIKRSDGWPIPKQLSLSQINKIKNDYKKTATFAKICGVDSLEVHMAHGYLLHEFMSPISNQRTDLYGGNLRNRCRILIEISKVIRKAWPANRSLGARITGTDNLKNGINTDDAVYLTRELEKIGFDYVCISSGGILPKTNMNFYKGFRKKIAKKIKSNTKLKIRTTGMLDNINIIEKGLKDKSFDFVAIGRAFLKNPRWIYQSVAKTKYKNLIPKQYIRGF